MKNTKLFTIFAAVAFLSLAALTAPIDANAQGRYSRQYSKNNIGSIISKLEQSSNTFKRDFDRALDNSNLDGTNEEKRINDQNKRYESAIKDLRREFNRERDWWSIRDEVEDVIETAQPINQTMASVPFRSQLQNQWAEMRNDLNTLADTFDLPGLGGGGWTGGGWTGGDGWTGGAAVAPPSWARGTFYGRAPDGSQIVLTIQQNGRVTANIAGSMSYGSYTGGNGLYIDGNVARVTRTNNGIRTTRRDGLLTIDYTTRNTGGGNPGGGWWGDPGWSGQTPSAQRPPSWARGTFYGTSPRGERITLAISQNGQLTANINGNNVRGVWTRNNSIFINGETARVTRVGNGIRTASSRETITYSKTNSGGNWGGGGGNERPASWAVGTYTGRTGNTPITLTITNDGRVTANIGGRMSYGTLNGSTLSIDGDTASVTSIRNGIRTTSNRTGQRVDYRRN